MEDLVVLVVCGVSGAGKSTVGRKLARRLDWQFQDADDFHPLVNVEKMRRGQPLGDEDRDPWLVALGSLIEQHLRQCAPLVLACSALKAAHRDRLGIDQHRVVSVFLDGPRELIAERMTRREHFMPPSLLDSQLETLEPPRAGIRVTVDATPDAVVRQILSALSNVVFVRPEDLSN